MAAIFTFVLTGCGSDPASEVDETFGAAVVSAAELRLAEEMVAETRDGTGDLEGATEGLIETLREHGDEIGDDAVELALADAAGTVAEWCPPCERMLDRELARMQG